MTGDLLPNGLFVQMADNDGKSAENYFWLTESHLVKPE
jgi:hypothetical protein